MHRLESPTQTSQTEVLHPILQAALANLDVQLEEELARYRRMRNGVVHPSRRTGRRSPAGSLNLISAPVAGDMAQPTATSQPSARSEARSEANYFTSDLDQGLPSPTNGLSALAEDKYTADLAIAAEASPGSIQLDHAPPHLSSNRGGDLARPLEPHGLDDYLESSEELLRSLGEAEAAVETEQGFMQSLLTPLGVGSMLLLLLSSTLLGYVLMNPTVLGRLVARNADPQNIAPGQAPAQTAMISPQPNLAAQEFKELNLDTLGTLKPATRSQFPAGSLPAPTGSPAPVANRPGTPTTNPIANQPGAISAAPARGSASVPSQPRLAPTYTAPSYTPPKPSTNSYSNASRSAPIPTYNPPIPTRKAPAAAPRSAVSSSQPSNATASYPHKVVIPYDSDRTLETVRKVVPDAYVRNFPDGAYIQLGATNNSAEAEARAQELRKQGISAEVVKK